MIYQQIKQNYYLCPHGRLAKWLGIGLQNRVQRFESATDLNPFQTSLFMRGLFCCGASSIGPL